MTEPAIPDFVVVGAAKSGTTALHHYLGQHPDIFLPDHEEPSFFAFTEGPPRFRGPAGAEASINRTAITDAGEYERLYARARPGQVLGDVSPAYLCWPPAAGALRRHVPSVRVIAILRHPVERAFSAYTHALREGREPASGFREALACEPERISQDWGFLWRYLDLGHYPGQLRRFYDRFPSEQVKVVLYDDLVADPVGLCQRLYAFVGAEAGFVPDVTVRHNVSGLPRSRALHELLRADGLLGRFGRGAARVLGRERLKSWRARLMNRNLERQSLDHRLRGELLASFAAEIHELADLIGRDLNHWLDPDVVSNRGGFLNVRSGNVACAGDRLGW